MISLYKVNSTRKIYRNVFKVLTSFQVLACEPKDPVDFERQCFFLGDRVKPFPNGETESILFDLKCVISVEHANKTL